MLGEFWNDLRYRARAIFRRDAVERELDEELRSHLEHEAEKYARDGMTREEAVRRARLAFGGVDRIKDDARHAGGRRRRQPRDVRHSRSNVPSPTTIPDRSSWREPRLSRMATPRWQTSV